MQVQVKYFAIMVVLIGIVVGTSVSNVQADGTGNPRIRFMHALAGLPNVDVYVDGAKQITNLAYSRYSGYLTLTPGSHRIQFFRSGSTDVIGENDDNYATGQDYIMFIFGREGERRGVKRFDNQTGLPETGQASVRFVNFANAPATPAVNVCITGTDDCRIPNVGYEVASPYVLYDATSYNFDLRVTETGQTVHQESNVSFSGRVVYTMVALGIFESEPPLDVVVIVDTNTAPGDVPTGAFLTPTMMAVLGSLLVLVVACGWAIWRLFLRWSPR